MPPERFLNCVPSARGGAATRPAPSLERWNSKLKKDALWATSSRVPNILARDFRGVRATHGAITGTQ